MKVYLVGGAVRDELLGLNPRERDWVVVGETPESMRAHGYVPLDGAFPVFRDPASGDEYALARTERKLGTGHRGFEIDYGVGVTLEQDLARRDLTVNAIARAPDGQHVDPFGGLADLHGRRLRHVTPAFRDDPLRLLRAARFAARLSHLGFRIVPETMALMREMAAEPELASLSAERVWSELGLALASESPRVVIDVLRETGAAGVLLPGLPGEGWREDSPGLAALGDCAARSEEVDVRVAGWLVAAVEPGGDAETVASSLRLPPTLVRLVRRTAALRDRLAAMPDDDAGGDAWLGALGAADGLRQPDQLRRLLPAVRAGLLSGAADADRRVALLELALDAALAVRASALAAAGLSGRALGEALQTRRAEAIEAAIARVA